jgi:hypothetical protein
VGAATTRAAVDETLAVEPKQKPKMQKVTMVNLGCAKNTVDGT